MTNFEKLGVPKEILISLEKLNFTNPTKIQEQAIPVALEGRDVLGSAQTGTGKTASFAIPLINHLINKPNATALILLPTRELAAQVLDAVKSMYRIKSVLLIGGDSMSKQLAQLKQDPRLIIGTPGRINDHLSRKTLNLSMTDFLVLDETDRMLDMGFGRQLDDIFKFLPAKRQTLMFSATMPDKIISISKKYLNNPVRISVGEQNQVAPKIKQENIAVADTGKYDLLVNQVKILTGSIIVFVKTKYGADRLAKRLNKSEISADAIHGDLQQKKRERVITDFRDQKFRVLVATDIAARGLDIPHIENVINYDLPQSPEDYIHRIGRTGRADAAGLAINFLTTADNGKWKDIQKLLNPTGKKNKQSDIDDEMTIPEKPSKPSKPVKKLFRRDKTDKKPEKRPDRKERPERKPFAKKFGDKKRPFGNKKPKGRRR